MRLVGILVSSIALAVLGVVVACDDAGDDDAGRCCAPDPRPSCCMQYGGLERSGSCAGACDGMPWPDDPGWTLIDDRGCKRWFNPHDTRYTTGEVDPNTRYCGDGRLPAGPGADASGLDAADPG